MLIQKWLSSNCHKSDKINLRITGTPHAYVQTLTKTYLMFQIVPRKILGGVAFTRYQLSICFGRSWAEKWLSSKCEKSDKNSLRIKAKAHAHLRTLAKNTCKVSKESVRNCRRSCAHKIHRVKMLEISWAEEWLSSNREKDKIYLRTVLQNLMHIFRHWRKHMQRFKRIRVKL